MKRVAGVFIIGLLIIFSLSSVSAFFPLDLIEKGFGLIKNFFENSKVLY